MIHKLHQAQKIVKARRMLETAGRRDAEIQLMSPNMQPPHSDTVDISLPSVQVNWRLDTYQTLLTWDHLDNVTIAAAY